MNRPATGHALNWIVPGLVGLIGAARLLFLHRLPDRLLVRHIPDDAFYYLVMGRNFALTGRWTFDGVEPASGFHLLWGYLLAAMYRVAPAISLHGALFFAGITDIACVTLAAWLAARTAIRLFGEGAQTGVAVVMLSAVALVWDVNLMETAPVLLASAAVLSCLCRTDGLDSPGRLAGAVGLGLFGMLARSDFGMLPLCLFAMHVVMLWRGLSSRATVRLAAAVLVGSVAGLAVVFLHTHWISAEWLQSSAQEKLLWSRFRGFSTEPARQLLWRFFSLLENSEVISRRKLALANAVSWGVLVALSLGLAMKVRQGDRAARAIVGGLCCTLAAYVLFYRYNSDELQPWYVANLEIPVAVLGGGGAAWLLQRQHVLTLAVAGAMCASGIAFSFEPPFTFQAGLYGGAEYVALHPELRPVGAWNAGIISYFGGGAATNLDGLVNDRILPYSTAGTLGAYVQRRQIRTIVDFGIWLSPVLATRRGDAQLELARCVDEQPMKLGVGRPGADYPVQLFVVRPNCPAAQVK